VSAEIKKKQILRTDWWSKTFAGAVLGLGLSLALCGLFAWAGPGGIAAAGKVQFVMWMIAPVWMLIFSFTYLISTGVRAIQYLLAANVSAYALLFFIRAMVIPS
jgi:hypothetical protein